MMMIFQLSANLATFPPKFQLRWMTRGYHRSILSKMHCLDGKPSQSNLAPIEKCSYLLVGRASPKGPRERLHCCTALQTDLKNSQPGCGIGT